jgi:proline iminopeptidase
LFFISISCASLNANTVDELKSATKNLNSTSDIEKIKNLVNFQAQYINGLYVNTFGDLKSQPIIFIHGGPGFNSFNFEFSTANYLANKGFYVVVYDQRGSGRSELTPIDQFKFEKSFEDLDIIIENLHIKKPILVGHSFGGTLAIKYAQKSAHKVKSLFLVSAPIDQPEMVKSILENCDKNYIFFFAFDYFEW